MDPNGRVAAVDLGGGERLRADAVVCTARHPGRLRAAAAGTPWAEGGPVRPVLAVRGGLARRGARCTAGRRPPTTTSTSRTEWDSAFDALIGDLGYAGPVARWSPSRR